MHGRRGGSWRRGQVGSEKERWCHYQTSGNKGRGEAEWQRNPPCAAPLAAAPRTTAGPLLPLPLLLPPPPPPPAGGAAALQNTLVEEEVRPVGEHILLLHCKHIAVVKPQPAAGGTDRWNGGGGGVDGWQQQQRHSSHTCHHHKEKSPHICQPISSPAAAARRHIPVVWLAHVSRVVPRRDGLAVVHHSGHLRARAQGLTLG